MPRYAAGTTTDAIVFHLLAPSAMAPSRNERGTARKNSSVLRKVMGIIINPSANPPASVLAVVAITCEKFTRAGLTGAQRALPAFLPLGNLQGCNISSIAAATGFNRETTRRRVEALLREGLLVRTPAGEIAMSPDRVRDAAVVDLLRKQLDAITRLVNDLIRDGVLKA